MISFKNLTMNFGGKCLFKDVSLNLLPQNRYGIVGANGAGKSTLLKILGNEEQPKEGSIERSKKLTIGLLKQDHFRYEHERVIDVVIDGKPLLAKALKEKEEILVKEDLTEEECYRLAEIEEIIMNTDGYNAESQAQKILQGLGVPLAAHEGPLSALSGGFKLRVLLAQALFQNPDVLLLDEPTNHLDITSIDWIESFLVHEYQGLLMFVSHDRQFINNAVTHILDLDYQSITLYHGNYEKFLSKKAEVLAQKKAEVENKQEKIDDMQAFVNRFGASASRAKQAQMRVKMIDKIEADMPDVKNSSRMQPYFNFDQKRPAGRQILEVKQLSKTFGEKLLFKNLHAILPRGQKCAVIGPNGVGKSTFLKILLKELEADQGSYLWGETVSIGYFAQDFHHLLNPNMTLLQWMQEMIPGIIEMDIRRGLGQMLFSGECARLIFSKLILEKHNVIILDEPTNHLDLEAIEGLSEGLKKFPGSLLFVSHNRHFVKNLATSLLVMSPNKVEYYPGTYDEYQDKYK
jgi:ATPase subunit of ABC transporter with duplicated ATPase domains